MGQDPHPSKTQSNDRHSHTSRGHEAPLPPTEKRPWKGARGPRSWSTVEAGAESARSLVVSRRRCLTRIGSCCAWACRASLRRQPMRRRGCCSLEPRVILPEGCGKRCCRSPRTCGSLLIDAIDKDPNEQGAETRKRTTEGWMANDVVYVRIRALQWAFEALRRVLPFSSQASAE